VCTIRELHDLIVGLLDSLAFWRLELHTFIHKASFIHKAVIERRTCTVCVAIPTSRPPHVSDWFHGLPWHLLAGAIYKPLIVVWRLPGRLFDLTKNLLGRRYFRLAVSLVMREHTGPGSALWTTGSFIHFHYSECEVGVFPA
jgi:hypothetical protein